MRIRLVLALLQGGMALRSNTVGSARTRRLMVGAFGASVFAPPAANAAEGVGLREQKLERMRIAEAEKQKLCEGRRGPGIDRELSTFDMTFDPPCYVSGNWELLIYAVIVGILKIGAELMPDESEEGRYYSILGVKRDASREEVEEGYRAQAKLWHPDSFAGSSDAERKLAEEKFKAAAEAYEILSGGRRVETVSRRKE